MLVEYSHTMRSLLYLPKWLVLLYSYSTLSLFTIYMRYIMVLLTDFFSTYPENLLSNDYTSNTIRKLKYILFTNQGLHTYPSLNKIEIVPSSRRIRCTLFSITGHLPPVVTTSHTLAYFCLLLVSALR